VSFNEPAISRPIRAAKRSAGFKALFDIIWSRSLDTFETIMKNIKDHERVIDRELNIFLVRECVRAREANESILGSLEKERQKSERIQLKEYLDPFDYNNRLQKVRDRFCEGTGAWVLKDSLFRDWQRAGSADLKQRLLWLVGIPGAGLCST
jgi:hypothetical protein